MSAITTTTAPLTFGIPMATPPGAYLVHAQVGSDDPLKSFVRLDVVNAAKKGQIAGSILTVDAQQSVHDA